MQVTDTVVAQEARILALTDLLKQLASDNRIGWEVDALFIAMPLPLTLTLPMMEG